MSEPGDRRIGALDGLRALAITLVLLFHLTPGHDPNQGLRALPWKIAAAGWSGVDLFFVLSGFLITGKLLAARADQHRFRDFYLRRSLRIFPLYYATLVLVFVVLPVLRVEPWPPIAAQLPFWFYYSNFVQLPLPLDDVTISHLWSLAVEEQFYVLWPAVIFLTRRRTAAAVCISVLLVAVSSRWFLTTAGWSWMSTFSWTPSRADGLAVGSLLALLGNDPRLRRWAPAALALTAVPLAWIVWRGYVSLVFHDDPSRATAVIRIVLPLLLSLFFGAMLVVSMNVAPLSRALSVRPLQLIARYSYGMYVFHMLLEPALMRIVPPARLGGGEAGIVAFFLVGSSVSTLLAAASYHAFESRFLRMQRRATIAP